MSFQGTWDSNTEYPGDSNNSDEDGGMKIQQTFRGDIMKRHGPNHISHTTCLDWHFWEVGDLDILTGTVCQVLCICSTFSGHTYYFAK
jgi:hypothetical protein